MKKIYWILFTASVLINACTLPKLTLNKSITNGLNNSVFSDYQIGFSLYDLTTQSLLFEKNANKFFIPASNTKLLTFYAGLCALGDSVATLKYIINNDSLLIYPQGDPSFLHPDFPKQPAFDFLTSKHKDIFLVCNTYQGKKFGLGWSWDDYSSIYATQITDLPLYGNMIKLNFYNNKLSINPDLPAMFLCDTSSISTLKFAQREETNNNIYLPKELNNNFTQKIPLYIDSKTTLVLLSDTLLATGLITKEVKEIAYNKRFETAKKLFTTKADTLYKHMLQLSDNYIAEQLLICIAYNNNLATKQDSVIKYIKSNYLGFLPDTLQWIDGSGLSRMNLNTPRNFTALLNAIYLKAGEKRCFELLSAGGVNGTLKNQFKIDNNVYVYAKTGTISNNYCLSGFLIGNSGKRYAFSFMNNNYMVSVKNVKLEVERFITSLKNQL